jgi:protein subunit release factor A
MKKILEIHAAEGGDDSKLFVRDLAEAYFKLASRFG